MTDDANVDSPYKHSKSAQEAELAEDFRKAEFEFKAAIRAADALPLSEYKAHFQSNKAHQHAGAAAAGAEVSEEAIENAYHEVIALPFLTRMQLVGFYARHQAIPEAKEACDDAFRIGLDPLVRENAAIHAMHERAKDLQRHLSDILGPANVEKIFLATFDKLDVDKNGFVNEAELKRAQLDITIGAEAQQVIRYLLHNYLEVEKASHDEFGIDINGISKADVHKYESKSASRWKRMKKD
ncbi:MAG TPA: hypothetical protein V6C76_17645 [Drouetiella sp.]